ncbi:MAG: T9SS type A sorting domain-containing protein [Flavobacteriales bacterium]
MKKIYLLGSVMLATTAIAQHFPHLPLKEASHAFTTEAVKIEMGQNLKAGGDTIWIHNFTNTADWTISASPNANEHGWSIGTATNSWYGPFAGNMGTQGNFARFRNGNPTNNNPAPEPGPFTMTYNLVLPDLTGVPAPHIEFEQFGARFIEEQAIQISTNGGTSWVTIGDNFDIPPLTAAGGSAYARPQTRRFNITNAIAANPANVMIRLYWDGAMNGPNMSYISYGWYVDNIRVVEGFDYDFTAIKGYYYAGPQELEYSIIPPAQVSPTTFYASTKNNGALSNGALLNISIAGGTPFNQTGSAYTIAPGVTDTIDFATWTPGTTPGTTYTVTYTVEGVNVDQRPIDNTRTRTIRTSQYVYARDQAGTNNNSPTFTGFITNISGGTGQPFKIGNLIEVFSNDLLKAIDVGVGTGQNVANAPSIYAEIYVYNPSTQDFDFLQETQDMSLTLASQAGKIHTLPLLSPVTVQAGNLYLIVAGHFGGAGDGSDDVRIATSGSSDQGTVLGFDNSNSLFNLINPSTPVVRMNFDPVISVEEVTAAVATLSQNYPNPFDATTRIDYTLNEASQVNFEVVDITGKVILTRNEGFKSAGEYTITLDANQLSSGVYFYTLQAGDFKTTKKMAVK